MENLSPGQGLLPEQEEAVELPEGRSVVSHHKNTAASDSDSGDSYTTDADETKAARPFRSRRLALRALAAVALALVLASALSKRLPSVETRPPVKASENVKEVPPSVEDTPATPPPFKPTEDVGEGLPVVEGKVEEPGVSWVLTFLLCTAIQRQLLCRLA
ncbi:hypothetical protein Emed_007574 [Eimeria media]